VKDKVKHSKKGTWRAAAIVFALVLVAAGAGVGLRWWLERGQAPEPLAKMPKVVSDVQDLRVSGDAAAADKKINEALEDKSLSNELKAELYIQKGHALVSKEDYKGAIEQYKKADELNSTSSTTWMLGDMYRKVEDNQQAIAYYKKAVELIPDDDPIANADR